MTDEQRLRRNARRRAADALRTDARRLHKAKTLLAWKNANRERVVATRRKNNLSSKFNLTVEQWDSMLASQGNRCASCGTDQPGGKHKQWHTDHCHDTDIVRGILCNKCNMGIGLLGDGVVGLRAALAYLERFECQKQNSTKPTSETDGRPKRSLHIEPNESKHTNWSAGLL